MFVKAEITQKHCLIHACTCHAFAHAHTRYRRALLLRGINSQVSITHSHTQKIMYEPHINQIKDLCFTSRTVHVSGHAIALLRVHTLTLTHVYVCKSTLACYIPLAPGVCTCHSGHAIARAHILRQTALAAGY